MSIGRDRRDKASISEGDRRSKRRRRGQGRARHSLVKPGQVGLELKALAHLLADWGKTYFDFAEIWRARLPRFRVAVLTEGEQGKHREDVPRELIIDEHRVIQLALEQHRDRIARSDMKSVLQIRCEFDPETAGGIEPLRRPFPCPIEG